MTRPRPLSILLRGAHPLYAFSPFAKLMGEMGVGEQASATEGHSVRLGDSDHSFCWPSYSWHHEEKIEPEEDVINCVHWNP